MKFPLFRSTAIFLLPLTALAALPPQYRMQEDLSTLVKYVSNHENVAATLKSIDMTTFTIHYGKDCWVKFGRKDVFRPPGWVGPAPDLEVKASKCLD